MLTKIPTIYKDEFGTLETEIINDYKTLTLNLEDVTFQSKHFDDFSPVDLANVPPRFKLNHLNELTNCSLLCNIPISATIQNKDVPAVLIVDIHLESSENEYNSYSHFSLRLQDNLIEIGRAQHFETALEILKNKLPAGVSLKCCYNCLYADYSVYGSAMFGTMFCFKNIPEQYLAVRSKDEYMEIFNLHAKQVQEIYLSADFEPRVKGTGYRGEHELPPTINKRSF